MLNKEIIKDYADFQCDRLAYLMGNQRHQMQVIKELFEANYSLEDFEDLIQEEENEQQEVRSSTERFEEWIRLYPDLFTSLIKKAREETQQDQAAQFIARWEDLQEVAKLSRMYFETLYPGKTRRADTIDGSIDGYEDRKMASIEERTMRYLSDNSVRVIFEGQVSIDGFLARWDVLVKQPDGYHLYEVKGSTSIYRTNKRDLNTLQALPKGIRKPYLYDIAFQQWVYELAGIKLAEVHFLHLDRNASFQEHEMSYPLDVSLLPRLFRTSSLIEDVKVKGKEKPLIPIGEYLHRRIYVKKGQEAVEQYAFHLQSVLLLPEVPPVKMIYKCRKCPLRDLCHPNIPNDHIFKLNCYNGTGGNYRTTQTLIEDLHLVSIRAIEQAFLHGRFRWQLEPREGIPRLSSTRLQIETIQGNLPRKHYLVPEVMNRIMSKDYAVFPLIFFDFETFNYPVPLVEGARPNQQVCCQYSMHVVQSNYDLAKHRFEQGIGGGITHYEYLGTPSSDGFHNPERSLIQTLKTQLIHAGLDPYRDPFTLVVYNKSFEQSRFREMAEQYPDESAFLLKCHQSIVDLLDFFQYGTWYHRDFNGKSSLKVTQPVLMSDPTIIEWYRHLPYPLEDTLAYHHGLIHNGGVALAVYQTLLRRFFITGDQEDEEKFRQALLAYCKIDSWGTVILYDIIVKALTKIRTNSMDLDWAPLDLHFLSSTTQQSQKEE